MPVLKSSDHPLLSFQDAPITTFIFEPAQKRLKISAAFARVENLDDDDALINVNLTVSTFGTFFIKEFKDETYSNVPAFTPAYALREICEITIEGQSINIQGFPIGEDHWLEYQLDKATIEISYEKIARP